MNSTIKSPKIRLTAYSHGAGCGCKISPQVLDQILVGVKSGKEFNDLIVGNDTNDDAAVLQISENQALISTTDFFMPIVDDAYDFGRIAATNAISDIYAMGGTPVMAISLLGWPVDKLPPEVAGKVIEGAKCVCSEANIPLAGGHSIDTTEPIFGLAVTGLVDPTRVKRNNTAIDGCVLFLTKPLGIGILTTAEKKQILKKQDHGLALEWMLKPNVIGKDIGSLKGIMAMTDVTGFGLLGHLCEMCEASGLTAEIISQKVPVLPEALEYLSLGSVPGGTERNFESYGNKISPLTKEQKQLLCDPQTSGGLLVAVEPKYEKGFLGFTENSGLTLNRFGVLKPKTNKHVITVL